MKKIIILLFSTLFLFSCTNSLYEVETVQAVIIVEKTYNAPKVYLPDGICLYTIKHPDYGWYHQFECECSKYQNGDTVWYYDYNRIQYLIY